MKTRSRRQSLRHQSLRHQSLRHQSRRRGGSGGSLSHRRGSKTRRRGGSELSHRRGGSRRRGGSGSFYPYNTKPMIFTNVSNTQQGGDARDTVLPSFLTNMGRDAIYQVGQTYNAFVGNYPSSIENPAPTHQKLLR